MDVITIQVLPLVLGYLLAGEIPMLVLKSNSRELNLRYGYIFPILPFSPILGSQKKPENMAWPVQTTASPPENCHDWRRPSSRLVNLSTSLIKNGGNPRTKWSFQWENHPLDGRMVTLKDDRRDPWDEWHSYNHAAANTLVRFHRSLDNVMRIHKRCLFMSIPLGESIFCKL